jgi:hypothetical protein
LISIDVIRCGNKLNRSLAVICADPPEGHYRSKPGSLSRSYKRQLMECGSFSVRIVDSQITLGDGHHGSKYAANHRVCRPWWHRDAERIKVALVKRLTKFKLSLNEDKTKLVSFSKVQTRKGIRQGVFDFLGFTFYLDRSRKGNVVPKLKTSGKRLRSKLTKVNLSARRVRNRARLPDIWKTFQAKLAGHIRYYGMSFNAKRLEKFLYKATRILF